MGGSDEGALGTVASLWRYPVKSMQGEQLDRTDVGEGGLLGDRAFALYDVETGKLASAKSPRMWPRLLDLKASFVEEPVVGQPLPPVQIVLSGGEAVRTDDPDVDEVMSEETGREVRLVSSNPPGATVEQYVPPVEGADPAGGDFYRDVRTDAFGTGALHDAAPVHLLTTGSLKRLHELYPQGAFDVRRFRPNVVVATDGVAGFVENEWQKRTLLLGGVRLRVTFPTGRCVMTTLPQQDLPKDLGILRTAARHNRLQGRSRAEYPRVGVYAVVPQAGAVAVGDAVASTDG